jgi:hypothetical protein
MNYHYLGSLKSGGGLSLCLQCGQRMGATLLANSCAMIARRTAGRLGDGGGPGTRLGIFPRPRRALPGEAKVPQIGKRDTRHQRVPVQPSCFPLFWFAGDGMKRIGRGG